MSDDITKIPTPLLKAMRDLCPNGKGITSVTFDYGEKSVKLTKATRDKADAELKRRHQSKTTTN